MMEITTVDNAQEATVVLQLLLLLLVLLESILLMEVVLVLPAQQEISVLPMLLLRLDAQLELMLMVQDLSHVRSALQAMTVLIKPQLQLLVAMLMELLNTLLS